MGKTTSAAGSNGGGSKWKVGAPLLLLVVAGFVVAFQFVGPPLPKQLTLATGSKGGAYHQFAELYREQLAASGITLNLLPTAGSVENIARLRDGSADIAFVQGVRYFVSNCQTPNCVCNLTHTSRMRGGFARFSEMALTSSATT